MRKAAVMIGFGAFFLTMALLMRFYAYPKLAVIPADQNTQQVVTDDHAKYFDADTVKPGAGKILTRATVVADKDASKKASKETGKDVIVINQWQSTDNVNKNGEVKPPPMDAFTMRVAVDKSSGAAVKWDGNEINGKSVNISGQTIKFPFQVSKNKTYQYFDTTLKQPFPMKFAGEDTVDGMKTYKFTQHVPKAKFTTMEVPGEIFGKPKGGKTADRYYENDRTVWVDPETGVMMKLQEKQHQTLEIPDAAPVNAMTTTSTMDAATVQKNVDEYKTKSGQLKILRLWAPLFLALLGILAIVLGLLVSLRAGRNRRAQAEEGGGQHVGGEGFDGNGAHAVGEDGQHFGEGQYPAEGQHFGEGQHGEGRHWAEGQNPDAPTQADGVQH